MNTTIHPYHREILKAIEQIVAEHHMAPAEDGFRYRGTTKPVYFIRAADVRELSASFARRHPDLSTAELTALLDSLALGETSNEFTAIGLLLEAYPKLRRSLDPRCLERWLEHAEGWLEVDGICQMNFSAKEMLADWGTWHTLLSTFAGSENIHKRRASLVLLTKPLRQSADPRLSELAFANVEKLKGEKAILITKAVSWMLRTLIKYHRQEVETYLEANAHSLPKIAVRETRHKLVEGVKG